MRQRSLPVGLLALLLSAGCAGDGNMSNPSNSSNPSNASNPKNRTPSCLPPGYRPRPRGGEGATPAPEIRGEELDAKLAVVEGEVITRRRLVREIGARTPGQTEAAYERALGRRLREKAKVILFAREAERVGVNLSPQKLEEVVEEELARQVREAEKTIGRSVTREEYLAEQNLTYTEFRDRVREELLYQAYVVKLMRGFGEQARPQVDFEVTPAEVRRIYWSHPGAFDEKPGIRFAAFQITVERFLVGDTGFLEAEEKALAAAEALAERFRRGGDPEALAREAGLGEGEWQASKDFAEPEPLARLFGDETAAWFFDPARRPRDARVVPEAVGPVVLGIVDRRAPKRIPYEEAYPKVENLIRLVRQRMLVEQRLVEILSTKRVVQPEALADELLYESRRALEEMRKDPVVASARFR